MYFVLAAQADQYRWGLTSMCKAHFQFRKLLKHSTHDHGTDGCSGLSWHSWKRKQSWCIGIVTTSKKFSDANGRGIAPYCNCQCWETQFPCAPAWLGFMQAWLWQAEAMGHSLFSTCKWSHLMARTVKEREDLAFVLILPASILDSVDHVEYSESRLNPSSFTFFLLLGLWNWYNALESGVLHLWNGDSTAHLARLCMALQRWYWESSWPELHTTGAQQIWIASLCSSFPHL